MYAETSAFERIDKLDAEYKIVLAHTFEAAGADGNGDAIKNAREKRDLP